MFDGHDPYLVALSVAIAILGGYTGFGLAARIRQRPDAEHRLLLAGAAAFLAIGIWTMHFVGMMAAPIPADAAYLVLPTVISFLICALVVGVSVFFVTISACSQLRIVSAAVLLGVGIASMHYAGMHSLSGHFSMQHDPSMVALSVLIAIGAAYGGLRVFLVRPAGIQLSASAASFGIAVSGMHYTAMYGVHFGTMPNMPHHQTEGLVASQQSLSLVVAVLCFVVAAGFLLSLVPDSRRHRSVSANSELHDAQVPPVTAAEKVPIPVISSAIVSASHHVGLPPPSRSGEPRAAARLPVEGSDGTHFIISSDVRSIRADAHYTRIHDGTRERMCPWSISEAETQLDPDSFIRVHRSYIVGLCHVSFVRKEGDGAVIELDGPSPHRIPVSRAKIAEVKTRLGLAKRASQTSPYP